MQDPITTPQSGASTHALAPASTPAEAPVSEPVEDVDFASSTWGGWTLVSDLDAKAVVADMRWTVQGIIPMDSVVVLYGSAYTGKSTLAVHLATCLASGMPFFGHVTEGLSVFYLALENLLDVQAHVLAVQAEKGAEWTWPWTFALSGRSADLGSETDMRALAADVRRITGGAPAALIVDALLDGIDGRDITSNADMATVMRHAHDLVDAIHGPVILVHHANRTAEKSVLGASVILTRADVHIRVEASKNGSTWTAEKVKGSMRVPPCGFGFKSVPLGQNSVGQAVSSCVVIEQGPVVKAPVKAKSEARKEAHAPLSAPALRLPRRP